MAAEYEKVKLFTHRNNTNRGAGASRNLGIENAQSDFIAFLDADDYYLPNRFVAEEPIFLHNADVDGVYGFSKGVFENIELEKKYLLRHPANDTFSEEIKPEDLLQTMLFGGKGSFNTNVITLRKSVFDKVGFFDTDLKLAQDTELWIRLASVCKLVPGNIETPIAIRTVHQNNRVLDTNEVILFYKKLVFKKLFIWAIERNDFPFGKMNYFFIAYHMYVNEKRNSAFVVLIQLLGQNPKLIFKSFFYRKTIQISFSRFFNK